MYKLKKNNNNKTKEEKRHVGLKQGRKKERK